MYRRIVPSLELDITDVLQNGKYTYIRQISPDIIENILISLQLHLMAIIL